MCRIWIKVFIPLVIALALVPLSSCSETSDEGDKIPQRIVSLAPSNTEILFALGLGDQVVGVTDYCDFPPEAKLKEKIGGFSEVNLEKVLSLSPDLVLAADIHTKTIVPELENRGLKVIVLNPKTIDELLANITQVGALTGKEAESAKLVADMKGRIEAVTDKVSSLSNEDKPGVFFITWHDPPWTVGSGNIINELIEKAGGTNIFADLEGNKSVILETIIARNPQVMLASTGHGEGGKNTLKWAQTEDRLRGTDARKNNRAFEINADLVNRSGPRIVDGLESMARCIHPEIFGTPGEPAR
ncbi:MAG: cobalamin-binding protein [Dehalococcoidia bacterium]